MVLPGNMKKEFFKGRNMIEITGEKITAENEKVYGNYYCSSYHLHNSRDIQFYFNKKLCKQLHLQGLLLHTQ